MYTVFIGQSDIHKWKIVEKCCLLISIKNIGNYLVKIIIEHFFEVWIFSVNFKIFLCIF